MRSDRPVRSALAPCIVLTYLLRGIGLFTILFLLGLTIVFSVAETAIALLLASVARTRLIQTGVSVLVLGGLLLGIFGWLTLLIGEGITTFSNPPREIYLVLFALLSVVAAAYVSDPASCRCGHRFPERESRNSVEMAHADFDGTDAPSGQSWPCSLRNRPSSATCC